MESAVLSLSIKLSNSYFDFFPGFSIMESITATIVFSTINGHLQVHISPSSELMCHYHDPMYTITDADYE